MPSALLLLALLGAGVPSPAIPTVIEPAAPEPPPPPPSAEKQVSDRPPPAGDGSAARPSVDKAKGTGARAEPLPPKGERAAPEPSTPPHPLAATPPSLTSRALLDELRRSAKDRQAEQATIADQRQKLEELKQEIEKSRTALREETKRLQALLAANAARQESRASSKVPSKEEPLKALAKTTRGMKAEQAAAVLGKLDRSLAAAILARMRPTDAAAVLEKMEPATSASLMAALAGKDRS